MGKSKMTATPPTKESVKTLGVVGGLGPESTVEYYRLLVAGYRERASDGGCIPLLIHSIDVKKVLALAAARCLEELVEYLNTSLVRLAEAGAGMALLAANTPHIVFPELSRKSPLPLISIVEAACNFAGEQNWKRLGLFGTKSTMQAGFYQQVFKEQRIEIVLPGLRDQNYIHEKYLGEPVHGRFLSATREGVVAIARKLKAQKAIEAVILGGTELPLLLRDEAEIGIPLLNTTRIHVQAALDRMFS
jgi:aspartate racemase